MANLYARRFILKGAGLIGLGAVSACDGVTFPGLDTGKDAPASSDPLPLRTAPAPIPPSPVTPATSAGFSYEIERTDADWRARLTPAEYAILREGGTEQPNSHRYTQKSDDGAYHCRGCALPIYSSAQKVNLDIGWVFFRHAIPKSILTDIDQGRIEAHCRRCGGHLGHILNVETQILHCINGIALEFMPA